jgi:hypothetical protein
MSDKVAGYFFQQLEKAAKGKYLQTVIKGNALQSLRKKSEDPMFKLQQIGKEYGSFLKSIRDPTIEALTALVIMVFIYPVFPEVSTWLIVSFVVITIVIVWAISLVISFMKDINRITERAGADHLDEEYIPT